MEPGNQVCTKDKREPPEKVFQMHRIHTRSSAVKNRNACTKRKELHKFRRREWREDPLYLKRGVQRLRDRTSLSAKEKTPTGKREKISYAFFQFLSGVASLMTGMFRIALVGGH